MAVLKVTYNQKSHVIPYGTREVQIWDLDMNELKQVVNFNADTLEDLETTQFTSFVAVQTYADLPAGVVGTGYYVLDDPTPSNNGMWGYDTAFFQANQTVNSGAFTETDNVTPATQLSTWDKIVDNNKIQQRTEVNRGSVSLDNNVVTLGIGIHYFKDVTGDELSYNVPSEEVYTLAHNESLVFNKVSATFVQKPNTAVEMKNDIALLNYDSTAGMCGGNWTKFIITDQLNRNIDNKGIDYHALSAISRASISISGSNVTIGDGFIYVLWKDGEIGERNHTETTYNLADGNSLLVLKRSNNVISQKTTSEILEDDALLFWNDNNEGVQGGLLMMQYLNENKVTEVQATDNHSLTAMSRASISISDNVLTLGDGFIYILYKDGTQKNVTHVSTIYTFANGEVLVHNKGTNSISKKAGTTILDDDAILFNYDSFSGGFMSGLLICKVLDDKINVLDGAVTKNLLTSTVKGIAHRGYSSQAPENTLPAYKLSKNKGFAYVECDIGWSSDNVPVLIHDSTIDRTSNGTGLVESFTLAELKTYDFGSWKSVEYTGTTIPTFEEFLLYCRQLNLYPYVEPKAGISSERATILIDIAIKTGMINRMTWLSFELSSLSLILASEPTVRVGYTMSVLDSTVIAEAISIKTDINEVFLNPGWGSVTQPLVETALIGGIPVEAWTVDVSGDVLPLVDKGVSGITTNSLNIEDVLNE